jgi:carbon monoxide dehydrogenase subunit G
MRKAHVIGLGVTLWAALAVLPAQAVVLRYTPEVGSTTTYKLTMKGDINMTMPGLQDAATGQVSSTMSMTQKALAKQDDGTKVEMAMTGGTITSDISGENTSQQMPSSKAVVVIDDRGRMAQVVSADSGEQTGQAGLPGLQDWGALAGYGGFPEGDVKAGDTWTDQVKVPASAMMPEMNLQVRSRLVELTTFQGHKVAKISSVFNGPISGDLSQLSQGAPQQVQGTMSGNLQGNFTCYYDYEKSIYVQTDGRFTTDINTQMSGIGSMQMKMDLTVEMKAK